MFPIFRYLTMLCPDVINFKSSLKHESKVKSGKLSDTNFETVMKTHFQSQGNIFGVKIVVPSSGPTNTPEKIMKVLTEDTDYYVVENNFDMSVIFDKTFHHNFWRPEYVHNEYQLHYQCWLHYQPG